jgi:hypothetical protein
LPSPQQLFLPAPFGPAMIIIFFNVFARSTVYVIRDHKKDNNLIVQTGLDNSLYPPGIPSDYISTSDGSPRILKRDSPV